VDKGTKGKRARTVHLIPEIHELTLRQIASTDGGPDARLFTGPRGGRITTAVPRDATSWDEVVTKLGHDATVPTPDRDSVSNAAVLLSKHLAVSTNSRPAPNPHGLEQP
jgi:hypothetical protein